MSREFFDKFFTEYSRTAIGRLLLSASVGISGLKALSSTSIGRFGSLREIFAKGYVASNLQDLNLGKPW